MKKLSRRKFLKNSGATLITSPFLFYFKSPFSIFTGSEKVQNEGIKHRYYNQLLNPREYPDEKRRHVHPPTWDVFGNQTRFTTLRRFTIEDGQLVNYANDLERSTKIHDLGDHNILPGKKFWNWGNNDISRLWDNILTDKDGPYIDS